MFVFDAFLDTLKNDLSGVIKEFGEEYKEDILKDAGAFAARTRDDLEKWARMIKEDELSVKDFEYLLKAKKDLAEMEALKKTGLTQAKLDKLKADILDVVLGAVRKMV